MKRMTIMATTIMVAAAAVVSLGIGVAAQNGSRGGNRFSAALNGFNENPSVSTTARGRLTLRIDEGAEKIDYVLTYSDIEGGAATASHIHFGAKHTNGGVVAFLCGGGTKPPCPPTGGTVTGVIIAADVVGPATQGIEPGSFAEFVRAIRADRTYVNVHSPRWPGGEIRGEIRNRDRKDDGRKDDGRKDDDDKNDDDKDDDDKRDDDKR